MTDERYEYQLPGWVMGGIGAAVVLALAALVWCLGLQNHLTAANRQLAASEQRNEELTQKQDALSARLRATTETLGQTVGMTQKQIDLRTQTLMTAQAAQAPPGACADRQARAAAGRRRKEDRCRPD